MFTGIVQGKAEIANISGNDELKTFQIKFPEGALSKLARGASIAINGTCLTATEFDIKESLASFDLMFETLNLTNLGKSKVGDNVNFERAASIGDEIGGHLMSGHIHCNVDIIDIQATNDKHTIFFSAPHTLSKYLLTKGFVGLNGCSLTIGEVTKSSFNVHLIPETLDVTTFGQLQIGDKVNLEIDPQTQTIVDTVERVLESKKPA